MVRKSTDWRLWLCSAGLCLVLACSGGGNQSGDGGSQSGGTGGAPAISSLSASGSVNQGETGSFTGTVSGNPTPSVSCSISSNLGSCMTSLSDNNLTVSYTAPIGSTVVQTAVLTVTANNGIGNPATANINLTIPVPQSGITTPQSGEVASGSAFMVSASASGMTALGFTLKVDGNAVGNEVPASNNAATIFWNTITDSNNNHNIAVVARSAALSATSSTISVIVSNSGNAPTLFSSDLTSFYGAGIAGGITVTGAGFSQNTTLAVSPNSLFGSSSFVNSTTMSLSIQDCNPACDPGLGALTAQDSAGTSNTLWLMFPSVANTGDCSVSAPLECYVLDSFNNNIYAYDQSSGTLLRTISNIGSGSQALAFDPVSKQLLVTYLAGGALDIFNADGSPGGGESFIDAFAAFAPAAAGGFGVVGRPNNSDIIFFTMGGVVSSFTSVPIPPSGSQPSAIAMTTLGSQVLCATYDLKDNQLSIIAIPQGTVLAQSTTVSGISPPFTFAGEGGWYLTYVGSTLAFVSRPDNLLIFFDGQTAVESRRVTLPGRAISLSGSNGVVEVGLEDLTTGGTKLIQVDPISGNISSLSTTAPFGATMLKVNAAGDTVFLGNRISFKICLMIN